MQYWNRITGLVTRELFEYGPSILGHGTFGIVYRGRKANDHTNIVAIKQQPLPSGDKNGLSKLIRELTIYKDVTLTGCRHLVMARDVAITDSYMFVMMEFCDGGDLSHYLIAHEKLSGANMRRLVFHMALALYHLSDNCIIHRDLKPANILISTEPGGPNEANLVFKMSDYGASRQLNMNDLARTRVGTPLYVAPEVATGMPYDSAVDIWSLGVTLYECLTGRHPFPDQIPLFNVQKRKIEPTLWVGFDISHGSIDPHLVDLINRMIKVNPADRLRLQQFFEHPYVATTDFAMATNPVTLHTQKQMVQRSIQDLINAFL